MPKRVDQREGNMNYGWYSVAWYCGTIRGGGGGGSDG